jgi:methionyl-tRNA synthetase
MKKKYYITTAIPYVNAEPHIGFALEIIQTDVLARYHRLIGDDVYFLTGTDENSLKNVQAAEKLKITPQKLCDKNAENFKNLKEILTLSFDDFIRTTEQRHLTGAQKLWSSCKPEDIYKKKYSGYYCVGCEAFYPKEDLVDGVLCPEHKRKVELVKEENYFFKLSAYQNKLKRLIESGELDIVPKERKNEIISFIDQGLEDFSISRSSKRAKGWGIPVPGDESQIMYVWFDALSNYITALGYTKEDKSFKKYWPADLHVIGKGIIRFHAIYWPAMLLSAGLPLPKQIFVHGYINYKGEKMSKSLGNVIDPMQIVDDYGTDALRYYLLREIPPTTDGDFTLERFIQRYNADLANDLGNLVSRVSNMIDRFFHGTLPAVEVENEYDLEKVNLLISQYRFNEALEYIWQIIRRANQYVEEEQPWQLFAVKNMDKLAKVLTKLLLSIKDIALALEPFLPETSQEIQEHFDQPSIRKMEPLFPRIL